MARVAAHAHLFFMATAFWTFYYLGGLTSGYYQTWHIVPILILGEIVPAILLFRVGPGMMRSLRTTPWRAAAMCAFWWSVPLLAYDLIILRLHQGEDWSYLWRFWYLTGFTLVPWTVFPALAALGRMRTPGVSQRA